MTCQQLIRYIHLLLQLLSVGGSGYIRWIRLDPEMLNLTESMSFTGYPATSGAPLVTVCVLFPGPSSTTRVGSPTWQKDTN